MVRVGTDSLVIFKFVSDSPDVYDKMDMVSLSLIGTLSHLEAPVA